MSTNLFAPLSPGARSDFRSAYLAYLQARDGVPDRAAHRFSVREDFFRDIDERPVRWSGPPPVSQEEFDHHHARFDPRRPASEALLWALCVSKVNRSEKYGVEYSHEVGTARSRAASVDPTDPHVYIEIEEFYHTRILKDALAVIGIEMEVLPPPAIQRALIHAMVRMPDVIADVLVFCGEIVGVALFELLLDRARKLFAAQPVALARIEALFAQILVDEVGHVHYARSLLGGAQLAVARRILPIIALGVGDGMPELWRLVDRRTFLAAVRRADVDAAAASYPDRFVWSARD